MDYSLTQQETPTSTHLTWVDFLRVLGTFLVVVAHIDVWGGGPQWAQVLYYTLSRNGVPLFFMISGFLLLSKEEDTWTFIKKRAWKILIPFFVWSIVYDVYQNQSLAQTGLTVEAVLRMFLRILRGPRANHLWFFYALIGLYLFTPILRMFVAKAKQSDLLYYIALWFLAVPILFMLQGLTPLQVGFELQFATGYVGYYLVGLFLGRLALTPRVLWISLGIFLLGFVFTYIVFYFNLPPLNNETVFRSYQSLNIVVMALATFVLLRAAGERVAPRFFPALNLFSQSSFGVYLMHSLVLGWMALAWQSFGQATAVGPSVVVIPFVALVAFLISFVITHLLRRIPFIKTIVP